MLSVVCCPFSVVSCKSVAVAVESLDLRLPIVMDLMFPVDRFPFSVLCFMFSGGCARGRDVSHGDVAAMLKG